MPILDIVVYGVGSFSDSESSRCQLSLSFLLAHLIEVRSGRFVRSGSFTACIASLCVSLSGFEITDTYATVAMQQTFASKTYVVNDVNGSAPVPESVP